MPHYVDDPKNHGKKIDVIELWRLNPSEPLPHDSRIIDRMMMRDTWSTKEAILLFSGFDPENTDWQDNGRALADIPYGRMAYLDGTMAHQLMRNGSLSVHPLQQECLSSVQRLAGYLTGTPLDDRKTVLEWRDWAELKGVNHCWLELTQHTNKDGTTKKKTVKPVQRQTAQEEEILRVLGELEYDPKKLPQNKLGKSGVKNEVRVKLTGSMWQGKVFDKAWERLSKAQRIEYAL